MKCFGSVIFGQNGISKAPQPQRISDADWIAVSIGVRVHTRLKP